jgi:hypothetical protein
MSAKSSFFRPFFDTRDEQLFGFVLSLDFVEQEFDLLAVIRAGDPFLIDDE